MTALQQLKEACEMALKKEPVDATEKEIGYSTGLKHTITLIDKMFLEKEKKQMEESAAWAWGLSAEGYNSKLNDNLDFDSYYAEKFSVKEKISEAEETFCFYKLGLTGSFMTSLISTIFKGDEDNRSKIALGFPELVDVCNKFNRNKGYWSDLVDRWNVGVCDNHKLQY